MEQSTNDATLKVAQIKLRKEECASSMVQSTNYAALMDARDKLRMEEYALSMGQHGQGNDAVSKDAPNTLRREECAGGIGQTVALLMKNLLLLHPVLDPNSKRLLLLTLFRVLQQLLRDKGTQISSKYGLDINMLVYGYVLSTQECTDRQLFREGNEGKSTMMDLSEF